MPLGAAPRPAADGPAPGPRLSSALPLVSACSLYREGATLTHALRSATLPAWLRACTHACKKAARNLLYVCCSSLVLT